MANTRAAAFAPATIANLGVGFDVMGLALCEPGDIVQVERRKEPGADILAIEGDGGQLPRDSARNTACVAANAVLSQIGAADGVNITLKKNLPLASGMGSSAASAVAAAVAVNALHGDPLRREELLGACIAGEGAVSGYHADNVAPCLLGGIVLVEDVETHAIRRLPIPDGLYLAVVTPNVQVPTSAARAVLPATISLREMVKQTAAIARLVDAIHRNNVSDLAAAMERDAVVEPARAHLMPRLHDVRHAAKQAGALAVAISGAGPSLYAICQTEDQAGIVARAMGAVYDRSGVESQTIHTQISSDGARVIMVD